MMKLVNDSRVIIVGGGPAGSFTALNLLRIATDANLHLDIQIFEARDFSRAGPGGCNKCAGLLSGKLISYLSDLDLILPENLILDRLDGYILHLGNTELFIQVPKHEKQILSVYRGSGPRLGMLPPPLSFDAWLLEQAQTRGAVLHHERVRSIRPGPRPTVVLARRELDADLVVVATGINSHTPLEQAWGYQPPRTEIMAQNEIPMASKNSGSHVHVFFEPPRDLIFGAYIPKGQYANISLLGHSLQKDVVDEFLTAQSEVVGKLADVQLLCGCKPHVAVSSSSGYYADRMVAVGDSAVTRLYKDGLGAAFTTAQSAARTAVELGISKQAFAAGYKPVCRQIAIDNLFGHLLFFLWSHFLKFPLIINALQDTLCQEEKRPANQQLYRHILWGLFTGEESYRSIFKLLFSLQALTRIGGSILRPKK